MKRIVLMRHAAAQLERYGQPGKDRTITMSGMHELEKVRPKLNSRLVGIDSVLCSNSKRTRQTLDNIMPILPSTVEVLYNDDIYKTTTKKIWAYLGSLDKKCNGVMIVAHNPGIIEFLNEVASAHGVQTPSQFPTCSVAIFETEQKKWEHVNPHTLILKSLLYA